MKLIGQVDSVQPVCNVCKKRAVEFTSSYGLCTSCFVEWCVKRAEKKKARNIMVVNRWVEQEKANEKV